MEKIQILFPAPVMRRLRRQAQEEDRPVSEVVRRAVERFLEQQTPGPARCAERPKFPTFRGGAVLATAEEMKAVIYEDDGA